jgi:hypothetical protein
MSVKEALAPKPVPAPIAAPAPVVVKPVPAPVAPKPVAVAPIATPPVVAQKPAAPATQLPSVVKTRPKPVAVVKAAAPAARPAKPKAPVLAAVPKPIKSAATVLKPSPQKPQAAAPAPIATPAEEKLLTFDTPTPAFRATQANRAEELHSITARSAHECPNCTAVIKPNTKRCGCGFEIVGAESQIPALSLSPEERDAFMAALSPSPRTKG